MRQIIAFTVVSIKMYFRTREAVLWNFIFPVFLFIIYVTAFSGMYGDFISKELAVADNLAKILTITFMSGGLFSLAISITVLREKGDIPALSGHPGEIIDYSYWTDTASSGIHVPGNDLPVSDSKNSLPGDFRR